MRTQGQSSSIRFQGASLLLIFLVALIALFVGHDVARAATFTPQASLELSTLEPGANPDISTTFGVGLGPDGLIYTPDDVPDSNFGGLVSFTPAEFTVPAAGDMPIGAIVAELTSKATLGLINGSCANRIDVAFTFVNASVDITDTIDPLPLDRSDNLQNLAADANANGARVMVMSQWGKHGSLLEGWRGRLPFP